MTNLGLRVVVLAVVAVMSTLTATCAAGTPAPESGPISASVPLLRNAFALGTLVRVDPGKALAEFRISCGWYYAPRRKLRAGLWKVRLRGLRFGWEANLGNPGARLHPVEPVSMTTWYRRSKVSGWSGTLRLEKSGGDLSNGPTTDICGGIAG